MPDATMIYVVLIHYPSARTMRIDGDILRWFASEGHVIRNVNGFFETTERFIAYVQRRVREEGAHGSVNGP